MAFSAILRRSASKAARVIGSPMARHYGGASAFSAVKRATVSANYLPATYISGRRFSSGQPSADKRLLEVVKTEIDVAEQSDDGGKVVEVPSGFPFKVEDNVGQQIVTLTREYEDETIIVEVSMPNLVTGEDDEDEPEDGEEDSGSDSSVPLLVTVSKKSGHCLEFDCTAFPDEIRINSLSLKNPETEEELAYEGPDFFDLDENLQKAFHKYLEIRGVKPSTTNFLHEYMVAKDNHEYIRWLKDVKKFIEV